VTALLIDSNAAELRRLLGPVPWFILEELLLGAGEDRGDAVVAHASARSLAAAVSLNKDTVARALAALDRAGAVVAQQQPNGGGKFGRGRYRVVRVPGVRRIADTSMASSEPASTTTRPLRTRAQPTREPTQLALLDVTIATDTSDTDRRPSRPPKRSDALAPGVRPHPAVRERDARTTARDPGAGPC
jgi:hypothetical protein